MKLKKDNMIPGVYWTDNKLATKSLVKNQRVYGETIKRVGGKEYRIWEPKRSKLGAAISKGVKELGLKETSKVLYLGSSSGTTCSHVSDMLPDGRIYALDFAPRMLISLIHMAHKRINLLPMLFDAHRPEDYANIVEDVDVVFQDVAQRDQVNILVRNCDIFLRKGGYALLALKARSVDVTKKPDEVFKDAEKELKSHFEIKQMVKLEPYEKDHMFFVLKKR